MLVWFLVSSFGPMGANKKDAPANQIFAVARLIACCPGIGPERWWRKLNNTAYPLRASHSRTKRPTIPWILFRQPYRVRWSLPPGNCLAVAAGNRSLPPILKMNGGREEARRQAQAWLSPLESHLTEAGLGDVSEIFEGDAPHRPRVYRSGLERGRNSTRLF